MKKLILLGAFTFKDKVTLQEKFMMKYVKLIEKKVNGEVKRYCGDATLQEITKKEFELYSNKVGCLVQYEPVVNDNERLVVLLKSVIVNLYDLK